MLAYTRLVPPRVASMAAMTRCRSMLKMLLDPMGGIVITNDGNCILREVGRVVTMIEHDQFSSRVATLCTVVPLVL